MPGFTGSPGIAAYADSLRSLETQDGHVLLFNCHLSMMAAQPFQFPNSDELLPNEEARVLFKMSSELPRPIFDRAMAEKFELQPKARGMVFQADGTCLLKFLDLGTRVSTTLR